MLRYSHCPGGAFVRPPVHIKAVQTVVLTSYFSGRFHICSKIWALRQRAPIEDKVDAVCYSRSNKPWPPPPWKVELFLRHHLTIFALLGDPEPLPKHSPPLNYHLIRRFLAREEEKKVCCSQGGRVKVYWNGCKLHATTCSSSVPTLSYRLFRMSSHSFVKFYFQDGSQLEFHTGMPPSNEFALLRPAVLESSNTTLSTLWYGV